MTPFKIIAYLCNLPSEENFLINSDIDNINSGLFGNDISMVIDNFRNTHKDKIIEKSQVKLLENGTISFIANGIAKADGQTNIFYSYENFYCYDRFNAFFVKVMDSLDGEGYLFYKILNIRYTSSENIEIIAELSEYSYRFNSFFYNNLNAFPNMNASFIEFKTSFIEWGYKYDSIYTYKNGSYKVNFDANLSTDLYAKPPCDVNIDILKWQSERMFFKQTNNNDLDNYLQQCLWEVLFVQTHKTTADGYKSFASYRQMRGGGFSELPYCVYVAPIINPLYSTPINNKIFLHDTLHPEYDGQITPSLSALKQTFGDYIISYQILPYLDMLDLVNATGYSFVNNEFIFTITGIYGNKSDDVVPCYAPYYYINDEGNQDLALQCFFWVKNIKSRPIISGDIALQTLMNNGYPRISNVGDTNSAILYLQNYGFNPYVSLHSTKLTIAFNDGQSYDFDPLNLGYFSKLSFKLYISLAPDIVQTYITLDTTLLNDSPYNKQNSFGDKIYEQNYFGLNINFDNTLLYDVNQYTSFMAQNKNFYSMKTTDYLFKHGGAMAKGIAKIGSMALGQATTTPYNMTSTNNYRISGPRNRLIEKGTSTKTTTYNGGSGVEIPSGSGVFDTTLNIFNDMRQTDYQMNNYVNAPNTMLGGNTNMLLENEIWAMGFYLQIWSASDLVKESLLETFFEKGIYINRFVDSSKVKDYFANSNDLDKKYKYIKGQFEFYYDGSGAIPYPLEKIKINLSNGLRSIFIPQTYYSSGNFLISFYNQDNYIKQTYSEKSFNS